MGISSGLENGQKTIQVPSGSGPEFTDMIVNATGPKANSRLRTIVASITKHLHDVCRENAVTTEEWLAAVDFINEAGRMSDDRRNEGQLLCGVLGIETLLDRIAEKDPGINSAPTATNLLGPFWRSGTPLLVMGSSIILNKGSYIGHRAHMSGRVLDHATGNPIEGAELDVWQSAPNGLYDSQDPEQPEMNLRGRFLTGPNGCFDFFCLTTTCYSIPNDGPAGRLLRMLDRHTMRPGHLHFIVSAKNYKSLVTELFDRDDEYIANDTVFAVKESLIVDFAPLTGDPEAEYSLLYDFSLAKS